MCPNPPPEFRQARRSTCEHRRISPAYWCEAAAYTPQDGRSFLLGSYPTATGRLALRWLRHRARDIADQLDVPTARPVRHWITNDAEHERALAALAEGRTYTITVFENSTRYTLSARPTGSAR
jgi:hypothetical protein